MANTCGEIRFMEGGTIKDSTVVSSSVVNSSVSSSNVDSSSITNLSSIDSASVRVIVQQIASLPTSDLAGLLAALLSLASSGTSHVEPDCLEGNFPAAVAGSGDFVLGKPDGWLNIADGAIPVYQRECEESN